jgi:hypothetical protein
VRYTGCNRLHEEAIVALTPERIDSGIRFLDDDEAREDFDREAQRLLGISGDEFLRRYKAGEYANPQDDRELRGVMKLVMLGPVER